jgi:3-(methylthio)propionyl---CoA ligase
MLGLMQRRELLISSIIAHAARHHGEAEVVSRRENGALARTTYARIEHRARKLMGVLRDLGVTMGERVATLAMNSDRHLELYYAISGMGAVCHTINPRLSVDDIAYILGHADDGVLFVDPGFLPLAEAAAARTPGLRALVVLGEDSEIGTCYPPHGKALHSYETLLSQAYAAPDWPQFDENAASGLCYTSGTTGRPKGVLYSHRSSLLHAFAVALPDVVGLRAADRVLPVVPMFHVNAWGLPYAAPMTGATLLMPGRQLDPASVLELMNAERADVAIGVPTVWSALLAHMRATGARFATLKRIMSGGAALPLALVEGFAEFGVHAFQGWGMTETSPVVTLNAPKPATVNAPMDHACLQGRALFGADVRVMAGDGEAPWDGRTPGEVSCRGHWIASGYFRHDAHILSPDGWLPTGDVGVIDEDGYLKLTDRTKDLIKSGGEWISSIELENVAASHPDVAEAAAIAVPDEKWGERPLVIVVPREGRAPNPEAIRAWFVDRVAKYAVPDRVAIAEALPHGATGKILKTELRRIYLAPRE